MMHAVYNVKVKYSHLHQLPINQIERCVWLENQIQLCSSCCRYHIPTAFITAFPQSGRKRKNRCYEIEGTPNMQKLASEKLTEMMAPAQESKHVYGSTIFITFIVIKVVGIFHNNIKTTIITRYESSQFTLKANQKNVLMIVLRCFVSCLFLMRNENTTSSRVTSDLHCAVQQLFGPIYWRTNS